MALCSQADLEALRQIDVTAEPDPTVTALIRHAEGLLEGWSGRVFLHETVTVPIEAVPYVDGVFYLPHYPIDPDTVVVEGPDSEIVDSANYLAAGFGTVRATGRLTGVYAWDWQFHPVRSGGLPWVPGTTITYTGGVDDPSEAPQALRTLCAQVTAMLFDRGAVAAEAGPGVASEGLGGWNVTYRLTEEDLTMAQRRVLRRYAHQMPVVAW